MRLQLIYIAALAALSTALMSGCASTTNALGKSYDEPVIPGKTELLNLTGKPTTEGAAEVYFTAKSRTDLGLEYQDRLIAFKVDDVILPGANGGRFPTGYQALALSPGNHSIAYCHTTRSTIGTGAAVCNLWVKDFPFEANTRYMFLEQLAFGTSMVGSTMTQTMSVKTRLVKLD